ncbi:DUF2867 domain-containing protein [Rhizobium sp.]
MPQTREVPVALPDPALPDADWADAFEIDIADRRLTAPEAARLTLGRMPQWVRGLMALRNALGGIVGLKTGSEPLQPGQIEKIGMFPILSQSDTRVVLGFDDWHLDFRVVVDVVDHGKAGTRLRATTLVKRRNLFGRAYIGLVGPFHRIIVPAALRSAA